MGEGESTDGHEKGGSSFIGSKLEPPSGRPGGGFLSSSRSELSILAFQKGMRLNISELSDLWIPLAFRIFIYLSEK